MPRRGQRREVLVGPAEPGLDRLKYEVAREIGILPEPPRNEEDWKRFLDDLKWEVAADLGLDRRIAEVGWGEMTSRECGRVGGNMGGRIGGNMVRRMIEYAERDLARSADR